MNPIVKLIIAFFFLTMSSESITSSASSPTSNTLAFAAAAAASSNNGDTPQDVPLLGAADSDSKLPSIKLGESISFQEMGPVIINTDGTTRRISNWNELSEQEREVSWRRIAKRNEERRAKLLEAQNQEAAEEGGDAKEL
jgi:hypothetical protein